MALVTTGIERLIAEPPGWLKGRRFGLLCNHASVAHGLVHSKDLLSERCPGKLVALFTPQHGLFGEKQDNMVESYHGVDKALGIPVFSLYSDSRRPSMEQLAGLDLLLVDLQDVGCRVYTFIWTLYLAMQACAEAGVAVAVLDRPNPVGGEAIEGNLLKNDCSSFVGMAMIPMRHGMTIGELAGFFADQAGLDLELHVVPMLGWKRSMYFEDTGLVWVWPSPNMPTVETAKVYPGQVVFEATNISEGRGTTRPFEVFGAPFLDLDTIVDTVSRWDLGGFYLRRQYFEPTFHKWAGRSCGGFQLHVTNRSRFKPYVTSLALVSLFKRLHPDAFEWKPPPYEYEYQRLPADLIIGDRSVRHAVEQGAGPVELEDMWSEELAGFHELRRGWLLYR